MATSTEDLLRELAPQVLGVLMRRYGGLDTCEDAVQEALLDAATQWPTSGTPDNPRGWLLTVATRRLTDMLRGESARRRREDAVYLATPPALADAGADARIADMDGPGDHDDTLTLLFLCCHPSLSPSSQVALTLRAVGGLTTAEIARAFGVPEATMAQRISRAKQQIRVAGARFTPPDAADLGQRIRAVQQVLYLVFNEGYTASAGRELQRTDLTAEGIRLARMLRGLLPGDAETAGLLALMLLTDARRAARTTPDGALVPLTEQDRRRWDQRLITEGAALVEQTLATSRALGPYQLQAAIAAAHDEAESVADTDWAEILALYDLLAKVSPGPMVELGRAVAIAMVHGPDAGLAATGELAGPLGKHHRFHAVRGHLHEMAGDRAAAATDYRTAAVLATNIPERRYLERKLATLTGLPGQGAALGRAARGTPEVSPQRAGGAVAGESGQVDADRRALGGRAEAAVRVQVGRAVARVGGVHLDRRPGQLLRVHRGDHVQRGLRRRVRDGRRHLPGRAGAVAHERDRPDFRRDVHDPGPVSAAQQRQHGVGDRDHAEHVRLKHLAHRVQ
jgi:RNA polymerase sigma factor (sigma-70 family)